jgi:hypothetical protein
MKKKTEPEIDIDQFININSDELECIFNEGGYNMESDFDYDREAEIILYSREFPQLIRKIGKTRKVNYSKKKRNQK